MGIFTRKKKRKLVIATLSIVVFLVLFPLVLEWLLNLSPLKARAAKLIEQHSGVVIDPDNLFVQLTPHIRVGLKDQALPINAQLELSIKALSVDIDFWQLVSGQLVLSRIDVESPWIHYQPAKKSPSPPGKKTGPVDEMPWFDFPKSAISDLFALFPEGQDQLLLNFSHAKSNYFSDVTGTLLLFRNNEQMLFNARLKGLDIDRKDLPKGLVPGDFPLKELSIGAADVILRLNAQGAMIGHLKFQKLAGASPGALPHPVATEQMKINFTLSRHYQAFTLTPTTFSYPDAAVSVAFSHGEGEGAQVTFAGSRVDIKQGRDVTLTFAGRNYIVQRLFDILRAGIAKDVTVSFSGKDLEHLWDGWAMKIKGSTTGARVKIPETDLMVHDITGGAVVEKGVLKIYAKEGFVDGSRVSTKALDIDLFNYPDFPFKGGFDIVADLATLPKSLITLLPGSTLAQELARIRRAEGKIKARLVLDNPSLQDLVVRVTADKFQGEIDYDRIPYPVVIQGGHFFLEDDHLVLTAARGHVNQNEFSGVDADIRFSGNGPMRLRTHGIQCRVEEFLPWALTHGEVASLIRPVTRARGKVKVSELNIQGEALEPQTWHFSVLGETAGLTTDLLDHPDTLQALSCTFDISNQRFSLMEVQTTITDLSWVSPALSTKTLSSIPLPLDLSNFSFSIEPGRSRVKGDVTFPSKVHFYMDMEGNTPARLLPRELGFRDGEFSNAQVKLPQEKDLSLFHFKGNLDTRTLEKMLVPDSSLARKLEVFTGGSPIRLIADTKAHLWLMAQHINLDEIMNRDTGSDSNSKVSDPGHRSPIEMGEIHFIANALTFKGKHYRQVKGLISIDREETLVSIETMNLCGLGLKGEIAFNQSKGIPQTRVNLTLASEEKSRVEKMVACLFPDNRFIDGQYGIRGIIRGKGPSQDILRNLNGVIDYKGRNGRIYKMTLLSRLLSVLNLLSVPDIQQKGFAYRSILVEGELKKGVIHLEKAVIDAENMAIFFKGTIDPFHDRLDLTALVAPLKTIDTIIQKIPIVRTLLNGRLVSFPAGIEGRISDPKITPLDPGAVGEGFTQMVENILKAPERIIKETF